MNRRRFLKNAAATGAAVVASSVLGVIHVTGTSNNSILTNPSPLNSVPVANFSYKPRYLLPSVDQTIQFTNLSQAPDGNSLTFNWLVDGQPLSEDRDYSAKLPIGQHQIQLNASDGTTTVSKSATITVEADQLSDPAYQSKSLQPLRFKGVRYFAGSVAPEWDSDTPTPSNEEMDEQLDTIHNELGCNAIIVVGGSPSEDRMIQCASMAIDKGFEKIYVQPSYLSATVDETIDKIGKFAPKVRKLREQSDTIVYMVGHEFRNETKIMPGGTGIERWRNFNDNQEYWNLIRQALPPMFSRIIEVCKANYGYPIAYASTPLEANDNLVPWSDPIFESVGVDAYISDPGMNEKWMINLINRLRENKKPIYDFDFGMESYAGADRYGGANPLYIGNNPYDEEPQARYTVREVNMFHQAGIDGCFWGFRYNDKIIARGHGLYNPQTLKRKKGFYMYKSYQITSS